MKIYVNYSIGEVLSRIEQGAEAPELLWLKTEIENYKSRMEQQIAEAMERVCSVLPENQMRWITENVAREIQYYVRCALKGKPCHVLMKNPNRWKTIADIGIPVEETAASPVDYDAWLGEWEKAADELAALHLPVFETHAHYNHEQFRHVRSRLVPLLHQAGIQRCMIPAVGFHTCREMKELFDGPEYRWVFYAFGSHPKYLWREQWTEEMWKQLDALISDPKCAAVGEAGLDYSYQGFDDAHREKQQEMFRKFIELANRHKRPMVLHIRPAEDGTVCEYDATADAIQILQEHVPAYGAVAHCFGGNPEEVQRYMHVGVKYFGIGGRICYGNPELEQAVREMPEESILLETDAPFIKLAGGRMPNTSLSLLPVAKKIAGLRGTTAEQIIQVTYRNAQRLFGIQ